MLERRKMITCARESRIFSATRGIDARSLMVPKWFPNWFPPPFADLLKRRVHPVQILLRHPDAGVFDTRNELQWGRGDGVERESEPQTTRG